jgi:histone H3/H4
MSLTNEETVETTANVDKVKKSGLVQKPLNYNTYLHKLIKNAGYNVNLTKMVTAQLDTFIKILSTTLSDMCRQLVLLSGRQTLNVDDFTTVCHMFLPANLAKECVEKGMSAIDNFSNKPTGRTTKAVRSGLSFPPHISEKFLRGQGVYNVSVSHNTPVFMAAVLENIVNRMLENTSVVTKENNKKTITVRHLVLGTTNNPELATVVRKLNIVWLGGGIEPYVNPALVPSKEKQTQLALKRRKARKGAEQVEKVRKSLPGTRALRLIKKYQKSVGLLQRKEHFKRFVKDHANNIWDESEQLHYSAGVIEYLQLFVEDELAQLFRQSVSVMVHVGRETVDVKDLQLVWSLVRPKCFRESPQLGFEHLAEPGIHRIAYRGGTKRVSQGCYEFAKIVLSEYVYNILYNTHLVMKRQKVKTLSLQYLRRGAGFMNFNLPVDFGRIKNKKKNGDNVSEVGEDIPIPQEEKDDGDVGDDGEVVGETPVDDLEN